MEFQNNKITSINNFQHSQKSDITNFKVTERNYDTT